jgi:single-strand DNA-binding protein
MNTITNSVQLIGYAGMNPEIKQLKGDHQTARFSLATNEYFTNTKGEKVTQTHWHRIVAWDKAAAVVEKVVAKGKQVVVKGKLINNQWEDKAGNKRTQVEVQLQEIVAV